MKTILHQKVSSKTKGAIAMRKEIDLPFAPCVGMEIHDSSFGRTRVALTVLSVENRVPVLSVRLEDTTLDDTRFEKTAQQSIKVWDGWMRDEETDN